MATSTYVYVIRLWCTPEYKHEKYVKSNALKYLIYNIHNINIKMNGIQEYKTNKIILYI